MLKDFSSSRARERRRMYQFDGYNPYRFAATELPLVADKLARLKAGELDLRRFLRQTPHFARWKDAHLRQAKVLLVTNELCLSDFETLYAAVRRARSPEDVAGVFHQGMLSWLSLVDHPALGAINGEAPWGEDGPWQGEYPRLAFCGKAGYFLAPGEEQQFAGGKVLHLELSPFAQGGGRDLNPRNDQDLFYHQENLATLHKFCELADATSPRYVFIVGNRARIRHDGGDLFRLEAARTAEKDRSSKIADMLRTIQASGRSLQVRICRRWPVGGNVEVMEVVRATAFELRAVMPCPI